MSNTGYKPSAGERRAQEFAAKKLQEVLGDGHGTTREVDWDRLANSITPDIAGGDSDRQVDILRDESTIKWAAAWKRAAKYNRAGWRMAASIAARSITRNAVQELAAHWPDLSDVPDGRDIFAGVYPVYGLPDNEELSRLVCDANLTGEGGTMTTTTTPMTVATLAVQEQRLEYDPWLGMWFAASTDRGGDMHRRWFETMETAQKWLDEKRGK